MTERVYITISGGAANDAAESVTKAVGTYRFEDGEHVIEYEENLSDDGEGLCRSVLRVCGQRLKFKRTGAVATELVLEPGVRHVTDYETPYGAMEMVFETELFEFGDLPDILTGRTRYRMSSGGTDLGTNEIRFEVRPM